MEECFGVRFEGLLFLRARARTRWSEFFSLSALINRVDIYLRACWSCSNNSLVIMSDEQTMIHFPGRVVYFAIPCGSVSA